MGDLTAEPAESQLQPTLLHLLYQANGCTFWTWGDVQPVAKPECRHGFPSIIRKVKKETVNKGCLFFCCGQQDSCNYFEWVPEKLCYDAKLFPSKQVDEREKQYLTDGFFNDLKSIKATYF